MEPQTSGPSVRDNAIFKTMWLEKKDADWRREESDLILF